MNTQMKTLMGVILSVLLFVSCSTEDLANILFPDGHITLVQEDSGEKMVSLLIDAASKDQNNIFIDLDADLVIAKDGSESVKHFGVWKNYYTTERTSHLIGKITALNCSGNSLTTLSILNTKSLTTLDCSNNFLNDIVLLAPFKTLVNIKCQLNNINGSKSAAFIKNNLPDRTGKTEGIITLIDTSNKKENNDFTKEDIANIKAKNWKPIDAATGKEYAGK